MDSLLNLQSLIEGLPIPAWRAFERIGSTNEEALHWAEAGAADLSLVLAEEQTAGRGRHGRRWHTPPASALAVSLILRPRPAEIRWPARVTALGALALWQVLHTWDAKIQVGIKWPNDVLVNGKKVAGVLVETIWESDRPQAFVLGMGVNVFKAALPPLSDLDFPATTLEHEMEQPPDRPRLLRAWLEALLEWREHLGEPVFLQTWESALLWREHLIEVQTGEHVLTGRWLGLEEDGRLRMQTPSGETYLLPFGEVRLRPHPFHHLER